MITYTNCTPILLLQIIIKLARDSNETGMVVKCRNSPRCQEPQFETEAVVRYP